MVTKMIATFRVLYNLQIWLRTNGVQMGAIDANGENMGFGQMGQMEDKWADKWEKYVKGTDLAGVGQMGERISLDTLPICTSA